MFVGSDAPAIKVGFEVAVIATFAVTGIDPDQTRSGLM
jgi:hypothetical protein